MRELKKIKKTSDWCRCCKFQSFAIDNFVSKSIDLKDINSE